MGTPHKHCESRKTQMLRLPGRGGIIYSGLGIHHLYPRSEVGFYRFI